jgi:hypothetical protein
MVGCPVLAFALLAAAAQMVTASPIFIGFACLAIPAVAVGIASSIWVTFGRSTPIERALGLFFGVVNWMALNGVLFLFQCK